ncbi:hypothetical protein SD78_0532 [Bacillus badius]|nr:hypothetical protein SD78_0532 [Bacillus badius]
MFLSFFHAAIAGLFRFSIIKKIYMKILNKKRIMSKYRKVSN